MSRFLQRFTLNSISRFLFYLVLMPCPLLSMKISSANSTSAILRRDNGGAAMVLSKHQHPFDILALVMAIWRRLDFMAKTELFEGRLARWYFEGSHCIEVKRDSREAIESVYTAIQRLIQGLIVLIFAEGTRRPWNSVDEIEVGAYAILKKLLKSNPELKIPIIAVGVHYGRKDFYFIPRWTVDIWIGPILWLSECGGSNEQIMARLLEEMRNAQAQAVAQARARGARSVYPDQNPNPEEEQEAV